MEKKELSQLLSQNQFPALGEGDMVFGHSASAGDFGFFSTSVLSGETYACRRWNLNNSTPLGEAVGDISYIRRLPSLLGLGCYLVDDTHNRKKLDPQTHNKFADGTTAYLDGSMGQYQFGWGTPFYVSVWREGSYEYEAAGLKPIPGHLNWRIPIASKSALNAGVMDRVDDILCSLVSSDERYRGGNGSAITTGTASAAIKSQLGYPATNMAITSFETKAAKRGTGWGAGWQWIDTVIMILFHIIMGTKNAQAAVNSNKDSNGLFQGGLGSGVTGMGSWEAFNGFYPIIPTNFGVESGDYVGSITHNVLKSDGTTHYAAPVPIWFGLKNIFGHLYVGRNRIVGVKQSDGSYKFYVAKSSLTTWNYQDTANMLEVGSLAAASEAGWEYIREVNFTGLAGVPSLLGATSSTYHCDGAYRDIATSGFRAVLGSGHARRGDYAGLACFRGSYAPSTAYACLSSPLCECAEDFNPAGTVISA